MHQFSVLIGRHNAAASLAGRERSDRIGQGGCDAERERRPGFARIDIHRGADFQIGGRRR